MKPKILTLQDLLNMEPNTIFATGETTDDERGINMMNTGRKLSWVATRGQIHDWSIFCQYTENGWSDQYIHDMGEKVHDEKNIKNLVLCDAEAFAMYNH